MTTLYDYIIVGGGPAGLAFAQCCVKFKKKVLILEREDSLGGCHRVRRIKGIFTEHGPRIYSDSYKTFNILLQDMGIRFQDIFTKYNFQMSAIGNETIWNVMTKSEFVVFAWQFIQLIINNKHGENVSMEELMKQTNFTDKTKDLVDRLCRLTDGAGADKYTVNEFLSLFNQQVFYDIYQPKLPLDKGLFKMWREYLEKSGYVDIVLGSIVEDINLDANRQTVTSITVNINLTQQNIIGRNYVFAIPPSNFFRIINKSNIENKVIYKEWVSETGYNDYICITFHYVDKLDLPSVYGFPKSDWGLAFVVLSDYMTFEENVSKTVISITFCYNDIKSRYTGKTANECSKQELIEEAYLQLRESFSNLPRPTLSLVSDGVIRDHKSQIWKSVDTAFMKTHRHGYIPFETFPISNLYTLGTHNGYHKYNFTSLEAAVSNSVALAHKLIDGSKEIYPIVEGWKVTDIVRVAILIIIILTLIK